MAQQTSNTSPRSPSFIPQTTSNTPLQEDRHQTDVLAPSLSSHSTDDTGPVLIEARPAEQTPAQTVINPPQLRSQLRVQQQQPDTVDAAKLAEIRSLVKDGIFRGGVLLAKPGYWAAMCAYLEQSDCNIHTLYSLPLMPNDADMMALAQALANNRSVKKLEVCPYKCVDKGMVAIAELLKKNENIENLYLSELNCAAEGCLGIASAISASRTITTLALSFRNGDGPNRHALYKACGQSQSVRSLDLNDRQMTTESSNALATSLEENPRILDLCLRFSALMRGDHSRLMAAIGRHQGLQTLYLSDSFFYDAAVTLMNHLQSNKTLKYLYISESCPQDANRPFANALARLLHSNSSLQHMGLERIHFTNACFALIVDALKSNRGLREMAIRNWIHASGGEPCLPYRVNLINNALDVNPVLALFPIKKALDISNDDELGNSDGSNYDSADGASEEQISDDMQQYSDEAAADDIQGGFEEEASDDIQNYADEPGSGDAQDHGLALQDAVAKARAKLERNKRMEELTKGAAAYLDLLFDGKYPGEIATLIAEMLLQLPSEHAAGGINTTVAASAAMGWPTVQNRRH
ncbi:leucine-rich repeat domain-containing protein [Noviherbaspirillum pedocola]|uniref:Uncharacterized protein n=1 Tax=Noviherbaspirillum pedocola TaxID=2801341 RepID=A0A934SUW2_9BURK|nr:hypothetical protein [Noviherbaspirillum pedocola]MBK4735606.1 hypothetical protein [Noviherbaspirillum pedocola]